MKNARTDKLEARVASEGYCCISGYLRLCRARGEKVRAMSQWIDLHRYTLYYHFRELAKGNRPCMKRKDCMEPIIAELTKGSSAADAAGDEASDDEKPGI